jgi:hypothetical protein
MAFVHAKKAKDHEFSLKAIPITQPHEHLQKLWF